jgi:hypothetical protein
LTCRLSEGLLRRMACDRSIGVYIDVAYSLDGVSLRFEGEM